MKREIYCRVGNKEQITLVEIDDKVKEQILAVRETGLTNMFDTRMVQKIAFDMEFWELVIFIEEHKDEYARFIFNGKR